MPDSSERKVWEKICGPYPMGTRVRLLKPKILGDPLEIQASMSCIEMPREIIGAGTIGIIMSQWPRNEKKDIQEYHIAFRNLRKGHEYWLIVTSEEIEPV